VEGVITIFICGDLGDGGGGLQVDVPFSDELFENESDKFVRPQASCAGCEGCADTCWVHAVLPEVLFAPDDLDLASDVGGDGLQVGDLALSFCHGAFGPEGTAAGDGAPFARHVVSFDVGANGVDVSELE
jgi:hypothetical protein